MNGLSEFYMLPDDVICGVANIEFIACQETSLLLLPNLYDVGITDFSPSDDDKIDYLILNN